MVGRCLAVWALACLCLAGCGSSDLLPVRGVVTLDGEPVEGASVIFHRLDGEGQSAVAGTDAQGRFELQTQDQMGAWQGQYEIAIRKVKTEGFPSTPDGLSGDVMDQTNIKEIWGVPKRYGDFNTAKIKLEITQDTPPIKLELTTEPEPE